MDPLPPKINPGAPPPMPPVLAPPPIRRPAKSNKIGMLLLTVVIVMVMGGVAFIGTALFKGVKEGMTEAKTRAVAVSSRPAPLPPSSPTAKPQPLPEKAPVVMSDHQKEQVQAFLAKIDKRVDQVKDITWYEEDPWHDTEGVRLYCGTQKGEEPWVRLKITRVGGDWVSTEKIYVKADDQLLTIVPQKRLHMSHSNDHVVEVFDEPADDHTLIILKILATKKCIIRFEGDSHAKDFEVTPEQKEGMMNMMLLFNYLKENPEPAKP